MPQHVRDWVADELGSAVATAADQVGGMSPGCATRLVCEDGTRAFVKAVGTELNPRTPELFRREVTALTLIGSHHLWADLRGSYDDGDWVAILLEDVDGTHPDLDDDATMDTLLRPDGTAVFCDWNWPVEGAAWLDTLFLLIGPRGDGLDVDAVLALVIGYFLKSADDPVPPTSPYIRDHQRWQGEVLWQWLGERRGW